MAAGERVKPAWYCTAPVLSCQKEAAMNYKGYKHIRWEQRLKIEGALRTGAKPAAIAQELDSVYTRGRGCDRMELS